MCCENLLSIFIQARSVSIRPCNSKYQFGLGAKTGSIREDPLIDCMKKNNN